MDTQNTVMIDENGTSTPAPFNPICDQLAKLHTSMGEYNRFDSKLDIPEVAGTRVVKSLYQANSDGIKVRESEYCYVPTKHITMEIVFSEFDKLGEYLVEYLRSVEDKMIVADHRKGALSVYPDGLSLEKIVNYLESKAQGSKLNKEMLIAWFKDSIAESLIILFADKMGIASDSQHY